MLEIEQDNPNEIHIYVQGTILKFSILEFAIISELKCTENIEDHLYTESSKSVLMAKYFPDARNSVKKMIFVQRFKLENFDNNTDALNMSILYFILTFVYSQIHDTTIRRYDFVMVADERLDLPVIEDIELNDPEFPFSHDTSVDHCGKRPTVDIHTHSNSELQDFEDFSIVPPQKILKKAGFNTDISTSQPIKRGMTVRFDAKTVEMQKHHKIPTSVSRGYMSIDKTPNSVSEHVDAGKMCPTSSSKSVDKKFNDLHDIIVKQHEDSNVKIDKQHSKLMQMLTNNKHTEKKVVGDTDKFISDESSDDMSEDAYFYGNRSSIHKLSKEFEGCSVDIENATLDVLVEAVVNQKSNYINVETSITDHIHKDQPYNYRICSSRDIDAIMEGLAAPVDELPLEVVIPTKATVNQHFICDSHFPLDFSDAVVTNVVRNQFGTQSAISSEPSELSSVQVVFTSLANSVAAQNERPTTVLANPVANTAAAKIWDFTRMNPPSFTGSKSDEDPQKFLD
ncbi:hypothetical protein BC332_16062 [Capsicum chinense]|nr:hypothetical protein BC332_16062 [Capsicum chinense]